MTLPFSHRVLKEAGSSFRLAWPIVGAQLAHLSMAFVDNVMVARLGVAPIATLAIATIIYTLMFLFAVGVVNALRPLIGKAVGSGHPEEVGPIVRHGLRISIALSALAVLAFQFSSYLLAWVGQDPALIPVAQDYLRATSWGMPALVCFVCFRQFTESTSDPYPSLFITLIGAGLNVFTNYVLIYGHFGFPALGVEGAGHATSINNWVMLIAMVIYIRKSKRYEKYGLLDPPYTTSFEMIGTILRLGLPISGAKMAELTFFLAITLLIGLIGTVPLAAHQIAFNAAAFTFMIPLGISMATSVRVAQTSALADPSHTRLAGWVGVSMAGGTMLLPALIFIFFPTLIVRIYTPDPILIESAKALLIMGGFFQIFDGIQIAGMGALQGLRDTKIPFLATLLAFWVFGLPLGHYLASTMQMGALGYWIGMVLSLALASLLHTTRFYFATRSLRIPQTPEQIEDYMKSKTSPI